MPFYVKCDGPVYRLVGMAGSPFSIPYFLGISVWNIRNSRLAIIENDTILYIFRHLLTIAAFHGMPTSSKT
jgi:hypothetical protein